jgi:predicted amidohydrolase YtcJ
MIRATSWKLIADGSNQGRTGYQRGPYLGSAARGAANYTADQLQEAIRYAHDRGWQVMVHANGDAAIDVTLEAYEKALTGAGPKDLRHRIEHCSIAYPAPGYGHLPAGADRAGAERNTLRRRAWRSGGRRRR